MKKLVLFGIAVVALAFGSPLISESANDQCEAAAVRFGRRSDPTDDPAARWFIRAIGGNMMRAKVEKEWPDTPPSLGCAAIFWAITINPKSVTAQSEGQ